MSDDDDDTSYINNEPNDDDGSEQPAVAVDQSSSLPPGLKRKRARSSGSRTSFDATSDPICLAILAFLNQRPAPNITHRAKFQLNGEEVSVGSMMYTLRRQSCKDKRSVIVEGRLEHLANNDAWSKFMNNARDSSARAVVVPATTSPTSTSHQSTIQVGVGLEGDIDKHAHCFLVKEFQIYSSLLAMSEYYLLLWQTVPSMRPTLKTVLQNKIQRWKKKKTV